MIVLSIISCMALLFSRYYPKKNVSIGLKWAFILLALVSGIRYNYGNDYINYLYAYNVISRATSPFSISISNGINDFEPGWAFFNWICKPIGFQGFVMVFSCVISFLYYRFIRDNVSPKYYTVALFTYLFEWSMFPLQLSMMRQGLVIAIFAFIYNYIKRRKWITALIVLFLCSTIHKTALILLPFAFWGYLPVRNSKFISVAFAVIAMLAFSSTTFIGDIYVYFLQFESIVDYGGYVFQNDINSKVLGFAFGLMAEIERNLISMRTKEALERRRKEGKHLGRKKGDTPKMKILYANKRKLVREHQRGESCAELARQMGVSRTTMFRFLRRY